MLRASRQKKYWEQILLYGLFVVLFLISSYLSLWLLIPLLVGFVAYDFFYIGHGAFSIELYFFVLVLILFKILSSN